jgi:hypothetical protein
MRNRGSSVGAVDLEDDADNVRYDTATNEIFIGFGGGGIAVVNSADGKRTRPIKLAVHPEAFALEKNGREIL